MRELYDRIVDSFEQRMETVDFAVEYSRQRDVALLHERSRVLETRYEPDAVHVRVRAPSAVLASLRREFGQAPAEVAADD